MGYRKVREHGRVSAPLSLLGPSWAFVLVVEGSAPILAAGGYPAYIFNRVERTV